MTQVLALVLPFFGLILLGYLAGRFISSEKGGEKWLNIFVVHFTVPALLFLMLYRAPFSELTNTAFIVATLGATITTFLITLVLFAIFSRAGLASHAIRGAAAAYGNVGYMGVPLAVGAFGVKAAIPATLIVGFDSVLIFTAVPILVALGQKKRTGIFQLGAEIGRKIFLNSLILACILGVFAAYVELELPTSIIKILEYLSAAAAPSALFALGVTVASRPLTRLPAEISALTFIKLVAHPLIVFFMLRYAGISGVWLNTAVLLASLPPALGVYVLAVQYNVHVERASNTILIGTVFSVATVSAIIYLIKTGIIG